jgi:voltage-gated potassium channel Kch
MPVDPISGNPIPEDKRVFTSIPTAMWWCIVTLTTTGYGDLYPVTVGGRVIAAITMLLGLVLFGILMNIVGRTLMVVLFGETHDHDHQSDHAHIEHAMDLFVQGGVISSMRAKELSELPPEKIRALLDR